MATNPLAPAMEPTPAPAPQPGLFDGQMPLPVAPAPAPVNDSMIVQPEPSVQPVPEQPEETQVAGAGPVLRRIFGEGLVDAPRLDSVIDPLTTQGTVGRFTAIREADPDEVNSFYDLVGKTEGAPSPTAAQREQGIPTAEFNLQNIEGPDELKVVIDNVSEIWRDAGHAAGRGTITFEQTREMAQGLGLGKVVDNLLNRNPGDMLNAEQIHASLQAITSSAVELERLARIASTATDTKDLLKFRQHLAFHAALQANMKGAQMEVARALGAFRIPRSADSDAAVAMQEGVEKIINDFGGSKSIKDMAKAYLILPSQGARNNFAANGFSKAKDMWFELWINGLLSSPTTHVINNFSNLVMQGIQIPERFLTGVIGAARQAAGSNTDRVYLTETMADVVGFFQGIGDGFKLSHEAWKTEAPVRDLAGKVEAAQQRAITAKNMGLDEESFVGKGVDYLGAFMRLPGRALMAEDEFWKAIAFRRQLNSLAARRAMDLRREAKTMRDNGADEQQIADAQLTEADILGGVDDVLKGNNAAATNSAQEFARVATFTNPVEGDLGKFGAWIQGSTVGRILMPFFRTPVQITNALIERSPYGWFKAYQNAKDPIKRDALIARASLGTSVMGYSMYQYTNGRITGSGPSDYTLRRQMEDIGWKRWSIVHPKVENPRWLQVGHMYVLHPDDVEYQSYHRMEPVSMALAVSADLAERLRWPTAYQEEGEQMFMSGVNVIFDYLKEQTFLQGMGNIAKLFELGSASGNNEASKIVQSFVGSMIPHSSLLSAIERQPMFGGDPTSPLIIADRDDPMFLRDFYAGLERMDARMPLRESEGPVLKDRFGSPRLSPNATVRQLLLPPIVADLLGDSAEDIDADPIKTEIVRIGLPLRMPERRILGIRLTAQEYDRFLSFASTPPPAKNSMTGQIEKRPAFYTVLKEVIEGEGYKEATTPEKQKLIQGVDTLFKTVAKTLLLDAPEYEEEFADLRAKYRKQKQIIDQVGRQVQ
jgi:hypothetical protein